MLRVNQSHVSIIYMLELSVCNRPWHIRLIHPNILIIRTTIMVLNLLGESYQLVDLDQHFILINTHLKGGGAQFKKTNHYVWSNLQFLNTAGSSDLFTSCRTLQELCEVNSLAWRE